MKFIKTLMDHVCGQGARPVSGSRTVLIIADDMLKLAKRRGMSLTSMQLVKLVYIAYGWHLAMTGKKLFAERIEAWKYGPIIPDLYRATKHFGHDPIPMDKIADSPLTNPELETFLASVVENYGCYPGIALSNLTHRPGTPWHQVHRPGVPDMEIPDSLILEHYRQGLDARQIPASVA